MFHRRCGQANDAGIIFCTLYTLITPFVGRFILTAKTSKLFHLQLHFYHHHFVGFMRSSGVNGGGSFILEFLFYVIDRTCFSTGFDIENFS